MDIDKQYLLNAISARKQEIALLHDTIASALFAVSVRGGTPRKQEIFNRVDSLYAQLNTMEQDILNGTITQSK